MFMLSLPVYTETFLWFYRIYDYFIGIGYYTTEEIVFDDQGQLLSNRTWNYRVPGPKDIPVDFRIKFPKNNPNPVGVLKSKGPYDVDIHYFLCFHSVTTDNH